jgi:hypothetical protein
MESMLLEIIKVRLTLQARPKLGAGHPSVAVFSLALSILSLSLSVQPLVIDFMP